MPAMDSMQTMHGPVNIEDDDSGLYQGKYSLPIIGAYPRTRTFENKINLQR